MENFLKRVSLAQIQLKAPKSQYNSFGKYKYRSCEDILEAAKPICASNGLVLTLSDKILSIGSHFYVEATATLHDTESEASLSSTASAREAESKKGMDESQITGTASSYARKYALNGLFNIDDTKDADTDEFKNSQKDDKKSENRYICSNCHSELYPVKKRDGTTWETDDMAVYSGKRYGRVLCASCMKAADKAEKEKNALKNYDPRANQEVSE